MCVCEDERDISIIAEDRKYRRSRDYDFSDKQVDEKLKIHYCANILMNNTLKSSQLQWKYTISAQ